jgi:hypothetical protein
VAAATASTAPFRMLRIVVISLTIWARARTSVAT